MSKLIEIIRKEIYNSINTIINNRLSHQNLHNEEGKQYKIDELKILKMIVRDEL